MSRLSLTAASVALMGIVMGLGACKSQPAVETPSSVATAFVEAGPDPVIFALDEDGVVLIGEGGEVVDRFAAELDGEFARYVEESNRVYIYGAHKLYEVDLTSRAARLVAELDAATGPCPGQTLDMQSASDMGLTQDQHTMCLTLQDRNDNMMDIRVDYRVDLVAGALQAVVDYDANEVCQQPVQQPQELCAKHYPKPRWTAPAAPTGFTLDEESCRIEFASGAGLAIEGDVNDGECRLEIEGYSASGRFVGLVIGEGMGDYIWRHVRLLDLEREALVDDWKVSLAGETSVSWHHTLDLLLIDNNLHVLGPKVEVRELGRGALFLR